MIRTFRGIALNGQLYQSWLQFRHTQFRKIRIHPSFFLMLKTALCSFLIFLSGCSVFGNKQEKDKPMDPSHQEATITPPKFTNHLIHETSPYLKQHAHNPVDWYPWGAEALEKAKKEDKPILLSIGYSACHWCHVMEHESFENEEIAKVMNQHFVNIKVDREERPDLDQIYMTAVQMMTGQGGWPMTMFLTPEGVPFYGGTYFPPNDRYNMPGFPRVLLSVAEAYRSQPEQVANTVTSMLGELRRVGIAEESRELLTAEVLDSSYRRVSRN